MSVDTSFETDPYPGNPRILFIGLGVSSHTHAWVDLLATSKFNVRLFSVPGGGIPPKNWPVRTYVCDPSQFSQDVDFRTRRFLYSQVNEAFYKRLVYFFILGVRKLLNILAGLSGMPALKFDYSEATGTRLDGVTSSEEWLSEVIRTWKPDIIHTLGLQPASYYYYDVRRKYYLENQKCTWVVQVRGGPDLALNRYMPDHAGKIKAVLADCDQLIADNQQNYEYAVQLGLEQEKTCKLGVLPGTGGVYVPSVLRVLPSKRERIILWPKAYESLQSKSLLVLEALKIAWSQLPACKILMFAADHETMLWYQSLPGYIREASDIKFRVQRDEILDSMLKARVLLAPSVLDGIPNSLYEAMAGGAFPIISPLETITPIVRQEENVLFARNLYPDEIAGALIRAMNDDDLVDRAAEANIQLVRMIADRETISRKVISYYEGLIR